MHIVLLALRSYRHIPHISPLAFTPLQKQLSVSSWSKLIEENKKNHEVLKSLITDITEHFFQMREKSLNVICLFTLASIVTWVHLMGTTVLCLELLYFSSPCTSLSSWQSCSVCLDETGAHCSLFCSSFWQSCFLKFLCSCGLFYLFVSLFVFLYGS